MHSIAPCHTRGAVARWLLASMCAGSLACEADPPTASDPALPPSSRTAPADLDASPRHAQWVDVALPWTTVPIHTWVVYPDRSDPAPVVLVIHESDGLTAWVRAVADQFAAEGFLAVAPDLISGSGPNGGHTASFASNGHARDAIRALEPGERTTRLNTVETWALDLPSANGRLGLIGFGWGGAASFDHAVDHPALDAAVVFYGASPGYEPDYADITAPVLALYGERDERVTATMPRAAEAMAGYGKSFEPIVYEGAGHGFLRAQHLLDNMLATEQAWPRTVAFLREHLEN